MSPLPQRQCQASLRKQLGRKLKEVNIINNGNRQAATIGLFPHVLKHMVKLRHPLEAGEMIDKLSRAVVRACTARFQEYQRLIKNSEALRTGQGKPNHFKCVDPFHFLEVQANPRLPLATCHCHKTKCRKRKEKTKSDRPTRKRKRNLRQGKGKK